MIDLVEEFGSIASLIDDRTDAWLRREGVPEMVKWMWPGPLAVTRIETGGDLFWPDPDGRPAIIQPVWRAGPFESDPFDLVAWRPSDPTKWWTRRYMGFPLGLDQLDIAEIMGTPLMLRRSPLSWLKSNCDGCCILDWTMSVAALRSCPVLICEDDDHAAEVVERFAVPQLSIPEIRLIRRAA